MSDFIINYLLLDRFGYAAVVGFVVVVFAVARIAWGRNKAPRKPSGE